MSTNNRALKETRRAEYVNEAMTMLNVENFPSNAAQKRVLDLLNRSYSYCHDEQSAQARENAPVAEQVCFEGTNDVTPEWNARNEFLNSKETPFDLHHVREAKHAEAFGDMWPEVEMLMALRAEAKAKPIKKYEKVETEVDRMEAKVQKTVKEMIEMRTAQYNRAIDLAEMFGQMPVTVSPHLVHGHKGTNFVRCFYYVAGKLTPLNVIIAAMEKVADNEKKAELEEITGE